MKNCCAEMEKFVSEKEIHISYCPKTRVYGIAYKAGTGGGIQLINFCPWCGKSLPKKLTDEYYDIIHDDLKLDIFDKNYKRKMPSEFKTDEWWKKRGL
jgi:hypothetical protein